MNRKHSGEQEINLRRKKIISLEPKNRPDFQMRTCRSSVLRIQMFSGIKLNTFSLTAVEWRLGLLETQKRKVLVEKQAARRHP